MRLLLVTSASGANGDGCGRVLGFSAAGAPIGPFSRDPRIADPRGIFVDTSGTFLYLNSGDDRVLGLDRRGEVVMDSGRLEGLDLGGGTLGPDGRYYVGLRRRRTVLAMPPRLDGPGDPVLPDGVVPFPRGFGFGADGQLYLSSGVGPGGEGDNTIVVFDPDGRLRTPRFVDDPELSPLDLTIAPDGNVLVSSEQPYGAPEARSTIREYERASGRLVRVFETDQSVGFARPRGLRFGPDGNLYCVGRDGVVAFDFSTGSYLGELLRFPGLHGQALDFWE
ncbi:MAG TPA: hypothetical protein VMD28_06440 [Acidimicrobiales bacterium]|nr:hypothetical protein [Acidimicrobiales bacterium]